MSKLRVIIPTGAVIVLTSLSAWAASWSNYFTISNLRTVHLSDAMLIFSTAALHNPAGCANADYYEVKSDVTTAQKEVMNRMLLSAFLAGRKVKVEVSGSCSAGNRPAYTAVQVDHQQ
jgi:hypothetical protein